MPRKLQKTETKGKKREQGRAEFKPREEETLDLMEDAAEKGGGMFLGRSGPIRKPKPKKESVHMTDRKSG